MDRQQEFVLRTLEERDIRFVRLWFTDVLGYLKSVAVAPAELEGAFAEGIGFDGSAIEGFARVYESDMVAHPDPATFQVLPWRDQSPATARMFCDISMPDGSPSYADPRYVLKRALKKASDLVGAFQGNEPAERARLELIRDEHLRRTQDEEKRYQIAKDLSDNLTISYNTSEVIMARLMQTTNAKERVYAQAVSFFSTNESVLTALKASFTGMFGLHESTQTLNAMKEGVSKSLEVLAEIGDQVGEAAVRAGYGPTIRADAVKKLVDSVITFQERSLEIVTEMRQLSTKNSAEIRDAVEEGKRRIARLVAEGQALPPPAQA